MAELLTLSIQDFCCIEEAEIVLASAGRTLVTGENCDTDAADDNGAGKSTIPKALTWALFETTLDGDKHDEVIRWGAKRAVVIVVISVNGQEWYVERAREKGKPFLDLGRCGPLGRETGWQGSSADKQSKIIELLGQDFRSFCNTTLFGENDNARFFSATDKQKKETLHRILRSEVFQRAEKRLREVEVKRLNEEVDRVNLELSQVRASLGEYDVKSIEDRMQRWEEERTQSQQAAAQRALDLARKAREVDAWYKDQKETLLGKRKKLAKRLHELRGVDEQWKETRLLDERVGKQFLDVSISLSAATTELGTKRQQIKTLSGKNCPTCRASLTQGTPAEYVSELNESVKVLLERRENLKKEGEQAGSRKLLEALENERREAAVVTKEMGSIDSSLASLESNLESSRGSYKESARTALEDARKITAQVNPHEAGLRTARARVETLTKQIGELTESIRLTRVELSHYEFWVRGFGSRGLPSLLLDAVMPFLTTRTNHYLLTLADGDITVSYSTQKELKSKSELKDEITVTTDIEGVPNARPSKGQKRKIEIASDLALVDLAATRERQSGLLWLDEVLDGLDAEGESRVLRLLRELRSRYGSLFVTSHSARISEGFDHVICARKENKATRVMEIK
jgi:DNA repair exonuclease SbcCD ATPase subunit